MSVEFLQIPFRRNQDIISIQPHVVAVVDGWSNEQFLSGNAPGRETAELVAKEYPQVFLATHGATLVSRAQKVAEIVDKKVLEKFPAHAACVGVFLFIGKRIDIVSVGTINTFLWNGVKWYKPKEIGNYFLPYPKYTSGSRTFFGRGELKNDTFYAIKADALTVSQSMPVLVATDGLDDVLSVDDLTSISRRVSFHEPGKLLQAFMEEIQKRSTQKDDISFLLRT